MQIQTGPIRFRIEPATARLREAATRLAARWPTGHASSHDVPVRLDVTVRADERPGLLPPERPLVREGDPAAGRWLLGQDPLWVARGEGLASVDLALRVADGPALPEYGLRQFLRHFVTEALLALGGIALHAASVARPGGASVFLATAGGGKTTLVRNHAGTGGLSDDMALVVPGRGGFWVVPSPFPGREGLPATGTAAPLARIADLVKGGPPACEPLPASEAVACLVARAKVPDAALAVRQRVLDAALVLARHPGVVRLGLPIDRSPWTLLDAP